MLNKPQTAFAVTMNLKEIKCLEQALLFVNSNKDINEGIGFCRCALAYRGTYSDTYIFDYRYLPECIRNFKVENLPNNYSLIDAQTVKELYERFEIANKNYMYLGLHYFKTDLDKARKVFDLVQETVNDSVTTTEMWHWFPSTQEALALQNKLLCVLTESLYGENSGDLDVEEELRAQCLTMIKRLVEILQRHQGF